MKLDPNSSAHEERLVRDSGKLGMRAGPSDAATSRTVAPAAILRLLFMETLYRMACWKGQLRSGESVSSGNENQDLRLGLFGHQGS